MPCHREFERRALRIVIVDRHGDRADIGAIVDRFPSDAVGQRLGGGLRGGSTDLDGGGRDVTDIACDGGSDLRPGVDAGDRTRRECHTQDDGSDRCRQRLAVMGSCVRNPPPPHRHLAQAYGDSGP